MQPLGSEVRDDVRLMAARELAELKINIVVNTRVMNVTTTPTGKQSLELVTITTKNEMATNILETDLYIPAFGIQPNTGFIPTTMLDTDGRVKVDRETLQAIDHTVIFALGDACNFEASKGKYADAQVRFLAPALQERLAGRHMPIYKASETLVFAVTIGRLRGTGQVGSWRLWGWIVRFSIDKHLGTDYASEIAAGNRTMTQTNW